LSAVIVAYDGTAVAVMPEPDSGSLELAGIVRELIELSAECPAIQGSALVWTDDTGMVRVVTDDFGNETLRLLRLGRAHVHERIGAK
jgi:hypothetical protein